MKEEFPGCRVTGCGKKGDTVDFRTDDIISIDLMHATNQILLLIFVIQHRTKKNVIRQKNRLFDLI